MRNKLVGKSNLWKSNRDQRILTHKKTNITYVLILKLEIYSINGAF